MQKKARTILIATIVIALTGYLAWRFVRPMNIFIVEDKFAWPVDTSKVPEILKTLRAEECGNCHTEFYKEWKTAMHSKAWTDPYFQADWLFDDTQQSCRLCHTPLDRQQPQKVLGYRDKNKWQPILEENPDFDPVLQHQGVTCAVCHLREGKIIGVLGNTNAPHPVKKIDDPNQICMRCHVVVAESWGTFVKFPPCGTVAEIRKSSGSPADEGDLKILSELLTQEELQQYSPVQTGKSGEIQVSDTQSLGCVQCHMPAIERPLVEGGPLRAARQHLWRGGHDPEMVKSAFTAKLSLETESDSDKQRVRFTIVNKGAAHYFPTGTPDRHLTVKIRLLDKQDNVLEERKEILIRKVMWRPFIIDLWDTRLQRWKPRSWDMKLPDDQTVSSAEVVVTYHLVAEKRRKRINYQNTDPIAYEVFRQRIEL